MPPFTPGTINGVHAHAQLDTVVQACTAPFLTLQEHPAYFRTLTLHWTRILGSPNPPVCHPQRESSKPLKVTRVALPKV